MHMASSTQRMYALCVVVVAQPTLMAWDAQGGEVTCSNRQ